jgi:acid phosphatase family membrane protein YuiD
MGLAAWIHVNGSLQVMYDASGVRLHAGRQAEVRSFIASTFVLLSYSPYCISKIMGHFFFFLMNIWCTFLRDYSIT